MVAIASHDRLSTKLCWDKTLASMDSRQLLAQISSGNNYTLDVEGGSVELVAQLSQPSPLTVVVPVTVPHFDTAGANDFDFTPGTVADGLATPPSGRPATVTLEHPSGQINVLVDYDLGESGIELRSAGLVRTARLLARGEVMVPSSVWSGH